MDLLDQPTLKYMKNRVIGLTGGIATGKSTVASMIAASGFRVIDADALAREVVQPGEPALTLIVERFGNEVIGQDGTLNRKALGKLIFGDDSSRQYLESVMHPAIQNRFVKILNDNDIIASNQYIFYEAALLFEAKRAPLFREVWLTHCDIETQIARLMSRDQINRDFAIKIIEKQMPNQEKQKLADVIIDTASADLNAKVQSLLRTRLT